MADLTETTTTGWFERIGSSIKGILFGGALFLISFVVLWWNEGRSIDRYKTLQEGRGAVVEASVDAVNPAQEGKLVHLTGETSVKQPLTDPEFGVEVDAIKLKREVEMYQWDEDVSTRTEKQVGGSEKTVKEYSYKKTWSSSVIDSSSFKQTAGHENPTTMAIPSRSTEASEVGFGAYTLGSQVISKIGNFSPVTLESTDGLNLPADLEAKAKLSGSEIFFGESSGSPAVGDLRVKLSAVRPGPLSVVAQQQENGLTTYQAKKGTILLVATTQQTADAMFQTAEDQNKMLTWILRGVGFLMMFFGLTMVFRPLSVLADVIPFIGNIVGAGTAIIAGLIALGLSFGTIAVAWVAHRPMLGGSLLAVTLVAIVFAVLKVRAAHTPPELPGGSGK